MSSDFFRQRPLFFNHAFMMFLCVINFDILRNLKESLLLTRLGAEAIPLIKLWGVMPASFIFVLSYSLLANRLTKHHLFLVTLLPFLIWVPLFTFVLYPNLNVLSLTGFCSAASRHLPENMQLICMLIEYWPLTLLFISAELWSSGVLCTLFWTIVNDTSTIESSTKEYPFINLVGSGATILSGPVIILLVGPCLQHNNQSWELSLMHLSVAFILCGFGIILLYYRGRKLAHEHSEALSINDKPDKPAATLPFKESVIYLANCPYLRNIAFIMIGYCMAINITEVAWKSQLVLIYPSEAEYSLFMGKLSIFYGVATLILAPVTAWLMRYSWRLTALGTPLLMLFTGLPFFLLAVLFNHGGLQESSNSPLLIMGIWVGMICNVTSKSAKYTLFDTTKEMAFVPLNNEQKLKGKASIELLVSRAGKSSSSLILQGLIITLGSLTASMHWLAGIFLIVTIVWLSSVNALSKQYRKLQH